MVHVSLDALTSAAIGGLCQGKGNEYTPERSTCSQERDPGNPAPQQVLCRCVPLMGETQGRVIGPSARQGGGTRGQF